MSSIKVLSVLQLLGHPRHSKRISMLKQAGFDVSAISFERDYHKGRLPDCPVETLGKNFARTIHSTLAQISWNLLEASSRHQTERFDLCVRRRHDFHDNRFRNRIAQTSHHGDRRRSRNPNCAGTQRPHCQNGRTSIDAIGRLIVVTAPSFYNIYYSQWLKTKTPGMVIENKLEQSFVEEIKTAGVSNPPGTPFVDRPFRIGYFGLLRDPWSWEVLKGLATSLPDKIEIIVSGLPYEPMMDIEERIKPIPNVSYLGQFKSPDDLPSLYNSVDMVWACYPPIAPDNWNLQWARPNRFYESCMFQKPTFTRAGCQDARRRFEIRHRKIIDEEDVDDTVKTILSVTTEDLQRWSKNMSELPLNVYSYTNEVAELKQHVEEFVGGKK